ncbi:retrovirus-related pol polyprotein from transposon TNT 1-94, partial [Tanacetum coccineum]
VEQKEAFQTLKDKLCNAPILSLPDGVEDFIVYYDASNQGLGCVPMQRDVEEGIGNTAIHEYGLSSLNGWTKIAYHSKFGRYVEDLRYMEGKVGHMSFGLKSEIIDGLVSKMAKANRVEVGDQVLLKVSPWKGVVRFRKKDKLVLSSLYRHHCVVMVSILITPRVSALAGYDMPILCIRLFTTVSKQWLRILTSPDFTRNRNEIQNIDPSAGLFVNHITSSFRCVFVSLDTRIKSKKYTSDKSFTLGYPESVDNVNILQSCNGLLLCIGWEGTHFYYVYNPFTNMVKMIPETDYAHDDSNFYRCDGLRLAFNPTKSPDYKVMRKGYSVWSSTSTYIVNTDDFMNPLPEGWSIRSIFWSIVLGEREEDSFLIINLSAKVVQYNLISKTPRKIYDMGSNEIVDDYLHEEPNRNARETYAPPHKVLTNDDLLIKIFIRLPILCIHLFTYILKQWLKILKSPAFTLKRSQIRCLDSPAGLFVNHIRSSFDCDFVSLDPIINSRKYTIEKSFTLGSTKEADKVKILQSCNGLILCTGLRRHAFDYVYNPSSNLLKILPEPDYANVDSNVYGCAGLRDDFGFSEFTIYEMMKGSSVWSVRYHVDTDDFMTLLPEGWSIRSTVWSIVLGEREDDSFLVINLSGKVVEYNLISKNLRELYDMGSNQLTNDYHDGFIPPGFIPPFAMYDMRPKQVDHKVYEFIPSYASV